MRKVLIVEDDQAMAVALRDGFTYEGYTVQVARDGSAGLRLAQEKGLDLVILDVMLPRMSGLDVCRQLRGAGNQTPIIMLTARGQEIDKVLGLKTGADDYVTKPFSLRELAARVRAVLRRRQQTRSADALSTYRGRHLVADFDAVSILVDGRPVRLTRREFELLKCLVENRNRVLSRDRLLERVWGYDRLIETRSVDVHIGRLRAKLGGAGDQIETVVGLGYRFLE
jgi:DNA-binding response OmpR family regulator